MLAAGVLSVFDDLFGHLRRCSLGIEAEDRSCCSETHVCNLLRYSKAGVNGEVLHWRVNVISSM